MLARRRPRNLRTAFSLSCGQRVRRVTLGGSKTDSAHRRAFRRHRLGRARRVMDNFRFTTIAHNRLKLLGPLSSAKLQTLFDLFPLRAGERVLDVGCGKGEMLLRSSESFQVHGVGVDANPAFVEDARSEARRRRLTKYVDFRCEKFDAAQFEDERFRAMICCGSAHAMGGYAGTLKTARQLVESGGYLILGNTFWKRRPAAAYLKFLGAKLEYEQTHSQNAARAARFGWTDLYSTTASLDDLDHYEGLYTLAVECHVAANPNEPDLSQLLQRSRRWRSGYRRWGRDTLGFGIYVFRKRS